ncbi:Unknown protein, partial [Striga hermonthica]
PMGAGPLPGFSGPSQTPVTPTPMPQGTTILGGGASTSREHEAREAVPTTVPAPLQAGPVATQQAGLITQTMVPPTGGAPQPPAQQVVAMTREEVQRMVADAAAQAVQQATHQTSQAATAPTTVQGTQEEDVSSYGGGGEYRDKAIERMAEQLRQLQEKVEGRPERRARGHPFSREILAAPLPASFREINLIFDGSSDPSRHVRAFENMPGPCRTSLAKTPARTYDEVLKRCKKYINLEETEAEFAKLEDVVKPEQKKGKTSLPRRGSPRKNSSKGGSFKGSSPRRGGQNSFRERREDRWQGRPRLPSGQRYNHFTPINAQMGEVLAAIEEKLESKEVTWPSTRFEGPTKLGRINTADFIGTTNIIQMI